MYDASAKLTSGVLSGNLNSFGDFDECLDAETPADRGVGQYCLAYVNIDVPDDMTHLRRLKKLSHSMETFESNFTRGLDDVRRLHLSRFASQAMKLVEFKAHA